MSDDIPDDINVAADAVAASCSDDRYCGDIYVAAVEAIMAERERCAKLAETFWNHGGPSFRLTTTIAAAIRASH